MEKRDLSEGRQELTRLEFATSVFECGRCFSGIVCSDGSVAYGTAIWSPNTFERRLLRYRGVRITERVFPLGFLTGWTWCEVLASQNGVCYYGKGFVFRGVTEVHGFGFFLGLRPFW